MKEFIGLFNYFITWLFGHLDTWSLIKELCGLFDYLIIWLIIKELLGYLVI